jgi:acetyl-CoA carboxylase biotin carboxylase subunit
VFKKILIANRGEIALRIIRACRAMGIQTVAVYSTADQNSLFVKLADESVCIGPPKSTESYLVTQRILSAAEITSADAIHPGYGFLAENEEFAKVCEQCGITFIGPRPQDLELMGDKIRSRQAMSKLGLSLLPSTLIQSDDIHQAAKAIEKMELPIIVKASAGGGGKGIKIVRNMDDFWTTVKTAQAEAQAAFGDSTVYVEKYLEAARHIEFQVAADKHGNVVHLGERDCSVQRRYQKIIEESPSPAVDLKLRNEMGEKVVKALKEVGYQNVGTVEFLMDEKKNFYFLEMNTRIQVEHPVTEQVTDMDLIQLQIRLAYGEELPFRQKDIRFTGHAMEFRINAEDPEKFLPSCGKITDLHIPGGRGVRVDSGIYNGMTITPYYDSMLAKLIISAETREQVLRKAKAALQEFQIEGISTNIPLHQRILNDESFQKGIVSTRYLDNLLKK